MCDYNNCLDTYLLKDMYDEESCCKASKINNLFSDKIRSTV